MRFQSKLPWWSPEIGYHYHPGCHFFLGGEGGILIYDPKSSTMIRFRISKIRPLWSLGFWPRLSVFFFQLRKRIWGWFLPVPLNRSGSNSSSIFRQRSGGDRCIGFSLLQLRCWVAFCFPFSDRFPYFSPREQKKTKQNNNAIARSSHQHGSRWHRRPLDVLLRFLGFFFSYIFFRTRSAPIPSLIGQVGMTAMKRSQTANSPFVFGP